MHAGVENANCLNCFFEIQEALRVKSSYYKKTYNGIVPEFKAGLHYGYVVAGEIGVVKRDIVFSGDVLNTAARIRRVAAECGVVERRRTVVSEPATGVGGCVTGEFDVGKGRRAAVVDAGSAVAGIVAEDGKVGGECAVVLNRSAIIA